MTHVDATHVYVLFISFSFSFIYLFFIKLLCLTPTPRVYIVPSVDQPLSSKMARATPL